MGTENLLQQIFGSVSDVLSSVAALAAVIIAINVEKRTNERFRHELKLSEKISAANVKPVLTVYVSYYENFKSIRLSNVGSGTAIITNVSVSKNKTAVHNIAVLFRFNRKILWDTYWDFSDSMPHLKAGEERFLVKLSEDGLIKQGISPAEALEFMKQWQEQIEGIEIDIEYEDLLGNEQVPYKRILKSKLPPSTPV